jgi:hypothetical protein
LGCLRRRMCGSDASSEEESGKLHGDVPAGVGRGNCWWGWG